MAQHSNTRHSESERPTSKSRSMIPEMQSLTSCRYSKTSKSEGVYGGCPRLRCIDFGVSEREEISM